MNFWSDLPLVDVAKATFADRHQKFIISLDEINVAISMHIDDCGLLTILERVC